jgi:stage IV sporulation protein FB
VHVTFLALVGLVALTAGDAGESPAEAVGWLMVLFACVLAHELAHALVAQVNGIVVKEIDLLPIGGVSRLERIPDDWRAESAIAAAGPITSLAIAVLAFLCASAVGQPLLPAGIWDGALLARLGWVNVMLAGFNLLPAFPLDGGRVLRALLERRHSRVEATRRAARISRSIAFTMIGVGLLVDAWLIVIGLFVVFAGRAEEMAVLVHAALAPLRAHSLAVPCPVLLPVDMPATEAVAMVRSASQPAFPVIGAGGRPVGLVNIGRLRGAAPTTPVQDLAVGTAVDAEEPLEQVAASMTKDPVVVTRAGRVIGVITPEILDGYLRQRLREAAA